MANSKVETAKAFIAEMDAVMQKFGIEEMIVIAVIQDSVMPAFVQDDPSKNGRKRNYLRNVYSALVSALRSSSQGVTLHVKTETDWDSEEII